MCAQYLYPPIENTLPLLQVYAQALCLSFFAYFMRLLSVAAAVLNGSTAELIHFFWRQSIFSSLNPFPTHPVVVLCLRLRQCQRYRSIKWNPRYARWYCMSHFDQRCRKARLVGASRACCGCEPCSSFEMTSSEKWEGLVVVVPVVMAAAGGRSHCRRT